MFLVKHADGSFSLTVPLPHNEPIAYKYVVDGEWQVSPDERILTDENGNQNNVLEPEDLIIVEHSGPAIPESGGLPASTKKEAGDVNYTVMPSTEGKQPTLTGEPGIAIPKQPEQLKAFEQVRDVDAEALNNQMSAEEKKKQKKKVKRSQYKAKKKKKKADVDTAEAVVAAGSGVGAAETSGLSGTEGIETTEAETENEGTPEAQVPGLYDQNAPESKKEKEVDAKEELIYQSEATGTEKDGTTKELEKEISKDKEVDAVLQEAASQSIPYKETEEYNEVTEAPKTLDPKATVVGEEPVITTKDTYTVEEVKPVDVSQILNNRNTAEVTPADDVHPVTAAKEVDDAKAVNDVKAVDGVKSVEEVKPLEEAEPAKESNVPAKAQETEKEVNAAPAKTGKEKHPALYDSDEEIVVAQGGENGENIAEVLKALVNDDVTIEEIKPTESEKERLTEDAQKAAKDASTGQNSTKTEKTANSTAKKPSTKTTKDSHPAKSGEKSKKSGFMSKLKKLFK